MLFELNENPKVIQQLLGHKDVKTTVHTNNRSHEIKFLSGENQDTKVNANIYQKLHHNIMYEKTSSYI